MFFCIVEDKVHGKREEEAMKKKVGMSVLALILLICSSWIYLIGGKVAPWIWSGWVFLLAPAACIAAVVEVGVLVARIIQKRSIKWNVGYLVATLIIAYPITVAMGNSLLTYPRMEEKYAIYVVNPVKDSVLLGGKDYKAHASWPSECYAYDLVKEPYDCGTKQLSDYGIYLAEVYAPVSGTVIEVKDKEEDILPNTEAFKSRAGNYIYMQVDGTKNYLILAHLEKDSVKVSVGDHVEKGALLAKVGNSGTTSEPHLHLQYQRENPMKQKFTTCAQGLPIVIEED